MTEKEKSMKRYFWRKWIECPPKLFRKLYYRGVFRIKEPDGARAIYLTFDDGPIPESTPWVLDTLDRFGIKATFFMVGDNVRRNPELYEEVVRRGHRVGNHTMHHLRGSRVTTRRLVKDVKEAANYIDSTLFRPPHGWMRTGQTELIHRKYRIIMFDHPRLFLAADRRRRSGKREEICPARLDHSLSRLAEEPAAHPRGAPRIPAVAPRPGV